MCCEQNYRSSGAIVAASNAVIAVNEQRIPKALRTDRPTGHPVQVKRRVNGKGGTRGLATRTLLCQAVARKEHIK